MSFVHLSRVRVQMVCIHKTGVLADMYVGRIAIVYFMLVLRVTAFSIHIFEAWSDSNAIQSVNAHTKGTLALSAFVINVVSLLGRSSILVLLSDQFELSYTRKQLSMAFYWILTYSPYILATTWSYGMGLLHPERELQTHLVFESVAFGAAALALAVFVTGHLVCFFLPSLSLARSVPLSSLCSPSSFLSLFLSSLSVHLSCFSLSLSLVSLCLPSSFLFLTLFLSRSLRFSSFSFLLSDLPPPSPPLLYFLSPSLSIYISPLYAHLSLSLLSLSLAFSLSLRPEEGTARSNPRLAASSSTLNRF